MKSKIRRAELHDFPDVLWLLNQLNNLHVDHLPLHFQHPLKDIYTNDEFASMLQSDRFVWLVAEIESVGVVGFLRMEMRLTANAPVIVQRLLASIEEVFVAPEYRQQGIGSHLMLQAEKIAHEAAVDEVCLNVYSFNQPALRFYEKLGYATASLRMRKPIRNNPSI